MFSGLIKFPIGQNLALKIYGKRLKKIHESQNIFLISVSQDYLKGEHSNIFNS